MSACHLQASGSIELFFYEELTGDERESVKRHLSGCAECRRALEELTVIRAALDTRPVIDAPPDGDWTPFMTRLEAAVRGEAEAPAAAHPLVPSPRRRRVIAAFAAAAVLALVTTTVFVLVRDRGTSDVPAAGRVPVVGVPDSQPGPQPAAEGPRTAAGSPPVALDPALASVSDRHFKRSKLVVLGLATKDPADATAADWQYERTLATSLLDDTRLYRQAAEERGMKTLADVMRDLELVLLQTSMSEEPDAASLAQLQRLIRRRDLITKMEVVSTNGLLP